MCRLMILLAMIALPLTCAAAGDQEVLYSADFDDEAVDFISGDPVAELSVTRDDDLVFAGEGSLELSYIQAAVFPEMADWGLPGALILPRPDGLAKVGEIAFALRSKIATPVSVVLVEGEDGPRYNCLLWCSADEWSEYSLTSDDFIFDREGPADPNGRLDLELTTGLAIIDAGSFVRMIAESSPLFHVEPAAEQVLWLDEFTLRSGAPEAAPAEGPVALAEYSPPLRGFLTLGGRDVRISSEMTEDHGFALRADYSIPTLTIFGLMHSVRPGTLADAEAIRFHARTNRAVTLIVLLEERRGPEDIDVSTYETVVTLDPTDDFKMITLPLSLFTLGDDETDPDGALNAELVDTFSIADATAIFENSDVINTLRLTAPIIVQQRADRAAADGPMNAALAAGVEECACRTKSKAMRREMVKRYAGNRRRDV